MTHMNNHMPLLFCKRGVLRASIRLVLVRSQELRPSKVNGRTEETRRQDGRISKEARIS